MGGTARSGCATRTKTCRQSGHFTPDWRRSRMGCYGSAAPGKIAGAEGRARGAFRGRSAGHRGRSVHGVFSRKRPARVDCQTSKAAIVKTQANGLMTAPAREGMDPAQKGRSSAAPVQQNGDGGINPPLQMQDRRARPAPGFARDRRMAVPQKPRPAGEERFIARKPRDAQLFFEVVA